jgi:hypothetical protein
MKPPSDLAHQLSFVGSFMIARNGVFSLEHNAPGCSGGVSHPVLTGLALWPRPRAAVIALQLSCNPAY